MGIFRGFIAIDVNPNSNIINLLNDINKINGDIKLVEPQNIHITLKFLGDTEETNIVNIEKILKENLKEIKPFSIKLKDIGAFPNLNYIKVIWIGIKKSELIEKIAKNIDNDLVQLGFKKENKAFSPHITIARVKTGKNKQLLIEVIDEYKDFNFSTQIVKYIKLKKSNLTRVGPIYRTLREVKL